MPPQKSKKQRNIQTKKTIWTISYRKRPRKHSTKNRSGYLENNGSCNRFENRIINANHPFRLKQIKDRCIDLENLIPPSLQTKNVIDQMEPATSFLEATMHLPYEETSEVAINSVQDTVNNGDSNRTCSFRHTSWNENLSITDAAPSVVSENLQNNEDYNISLADEMTTLPPAPKPIILTPKELYDVVNLGNEDRLPWKNVTRLNRSNYYKASSVLKNDYLRKYKSYLHSLSSEQLYKHRAEIVLNEMLR